MQIGNKNRSFPENQLVGADKVLARVHHEHTVSKNYTPIQLGEILTTRSFTATGEINKLALKDKEKTKWTIEEGEFTEKEGSLWDPDNQWAIIDGLESIRWCWILFEVGAEDAVNKYIDFYIKLLRTKAQKLPQIKNLWLAASWKLALGLRAGETLETCSEVIMTDTTFIQDKLSQVWTEKGKGKGSRQQHEPTTPERGRRTDRSSSWIKSPRTDRSRTRGAEKQICNRFQKGTCTDGTSCKYKHVCGKCGKPNHGSEECWANKPNKGKGKGKGKNKKIKHSSTEEAPEDNSRKHQ